MIPREAKLVVADNSGAKIAECIGIPRYSNKKYAYVGDVITVAIKSAIPASNVKPGSVYRAVVIRTRKEIRRKDGSYVRFDDNACALLNQQGDPIGTRIFGPVAREVREKKFAKIASLAEEVI